MGLINLKKNNKVKPGQIRFTPMDNRLLEMPPTVNKSSNPPSWFKRIHRDQGSVRSCAGTIDYLAAGVTLPLWTNVYFRPTQDRLAWEFGADDMSPPAGINIISGFPFESTGKCPVTDIREIETGSYPKLVNPWRIETAPGWSTMFLPLLWEPNKNWSVVPAVVHTDFYHTANVVLNITGESEFTIRYGTPMVQLIPFKRSDDYEEILFGDESDFKYVATRGFGMGHISPRNHTSAPYRRERIRVDKEIEDNKKLGIFKRQK